MALHDFVTRGGRDYPDRDALYFEDRKWTYGELDAITDRIAGNLLSQGLRRGDRVALLFANGPEIVFSYYACFKAGLIAVPLNPRMKGPELAYVLNHSGARALLAQADLYRELEAERAGLSTLEACFLSGEAPITSSNPRFETLSEPVSGSTAGCAIGDDHIAAILYTSGTTARPKGVIHSHASLERMVEAVSAVMGAAALPISAAVPSLAHMGSLGATMLSSHRLGGALVVFASFDPCALLRGIEAHRVTSFWLPPVLYAVLVRVANAPSFNLDSFDLSSLRACICAGDSMPAEIRAQFRETFGRELVEVCGMTEVIYSCNPPDHRNRPGSIGRALPGVQMRLVDDCGVEVPRGETGEILAQGPCMMHGYWDDPIATAEALRNGWMHTGDLAWEDEDGYYWFVGRKKDIIIRGGSNISPAEVEDALYTHPAVLAAGVVGRPDPLWGQSVCAFVALRPNADTNEETLIAHVRERLAAYKVPETIRIMPSLPIGLTGKIHRQTLRESAVASLPLV